MATFQIAPSVNFTETDLTTGIPAVATTTGAFAGEFEWGPVSEVVTVSSEPELVELFGKPNNSTYSSFYPARNFLSYSSDLQLIRIATAAQKNAVASGTAIAVKNLTEWETNYADGSANVGSFIAKYPGTRGNSIKVSMADKYSWQRVVAGTIALTIGSATLTGTTTQFLSDVAVGDYLEFSSAGSIVNSVYVPSQYVTDAGGARIRLKVKTVDSNTSLTVEVAPAVAATSAVGIANWEYQEQFSTAPYDSDSAIAAGASNDGLHIIVVDFDGKITGVAGRVLEKLENVFKASNATKYDGSVAYYKNALRDSAWLWWMDHPASGQVSSTGIDFGSPVSAGTFKNLTKPYSVALTGGADGYGATAGEQQLAFGIFKDDSKYDISLVFAGKVPLSTAQYVVHDVAESRRDCVAFVSPVKLSDNSVIVGDTDANYDAILAFRTALADSSYGVLDSGFKYQYDKYNDVYRYVALNGDIAGLFARSDYLRNAWASAAGYNRGIVKDVTRLAVNPNKTYRNTLFKNAVNYVVTEQGVGPVLLSDKTLLSRDSAFDQISVRRLFIVLEKAIASAAKYFLFEQNSELTQKLFVNMITPFLRDIKGREGISDFYVDVGPTVNTAAVKQRKEFACNIYIKPTYAIRYISLNFIATPEGVSFSELA